jgi:hypothetical protein
MRRNPIKFTQVSEHLFPNANDRNLYSLAAALTLSGLENRWVKLNAATQRALIGDARFGKQSIGLFDGQLMVTRKVCFGTDWDTRLVRAAA